MTLLLSTLSLLLACGDAVDTGSQDTAVEDTQPAAALYDCDFSAIAGDWQGTTSQGLDQTLSIDPGADFEQIIGTNFLYADSEEPRCAFEMLCKLPAEDKPLQVYNQVSPGSATTCNPGWYTFERVDDALRVEFHQEQDSAILLDYTLQAK